CHARKWLRSSALSPLKERSALGRVACKSSHPPKPSRHVTDRRCKRRANRGLPSHTASRTTPKSFPTREQLPKRSDSGIAPSKFPPRGTRCLVVSDWRDRGGA